MGLVNTFSHFCDIYFYMHKFAGRLKELRLEKGLTQAQLSKKIGLSHTALVYWETEQRVPNARAIIILSRFFDVSAGYLLGEED